MKKTNFTVTRYYDVILVPKKIKFLGLGNSDAGFCFNKNSFLRQDRQIKKLFSIITLLSLYKNHTKMMNNCAKFHACTSSTFRGITCKSDRQNCSIYSIDMSHETLIKIAGRGVENQSIHYFDI